MCAGLYCRNVECDFWVLNCQGECHWAWCGYPCSRKYFVFKDPISGAFLMVFSGFEYLRSLVTYCFWEWLYAQTSDCDLRHSLNFSSPLTGLCGPWTGKGRKSSYYLLLYTRHFTCKIPSNPPDNSERKVAHPYITHEHSSADGGGGCWALVCLLFPLFHDAPPGKPGKQVAFSIGNGLTSVALCVDGEVMQKYQLQCLQFGKQGGTTALSPGLHPVCMLFIKFNVRKNSYLWCLFFCHRPILQFSDIYGMSSGEPCSDISDWSSRPCTDCPYLWCCPLSRSTQVQILGSPRLGNLLERLHGVWGETFLMFTGLLKGYNSGTAKQETLGCGLWGGQSPHPLPAHHPPSSPECWAAQVPKPCCWDLSGSFIIRCDLSHWPLMIELSL